MDEIRHKKLEEQLREELSSLILSGEVKDPRVGPFVSLTRVEAARDLSVAKVFVSAFGVLSGPAGGEGLEAEDDGAAKAKADLAEIRRIDEACAGLNHAAGFIQARVGKRIHLRLTPRLTFVADHGIKEGFDLNEKIKGLLK
jgi:ribosome-binding factor A